MFGHPGQAEPYLVPLTPDLLGLARLAAEDAGLLMQAVPAEQQSLCAQATAVANARCSNLLEGETGTDFIDAHMAAEAAMDRVDCVGQAGLGTAVLQEIHREFYGRVGAGQVVPGALRTVNVKVQRHVPPHWESVPAFLRRSDEVYLKSRRSLEELLIVAAVAQHRMLWVHPFRDGNGRAVRLQTQLVLRPLASRFWSLSYGLLCRREAYYRMLAAADSPRLSDLDGRGNLSQSRLVDWVKFFISVCHEEIRQALELQGGGATAM